MPARDYIDFKLYLTAAPEGMGFCQVAVLPTPEVGEAIVPVMVDTDSAPRTDLCAQLASKSITQRNLATLGKQLADCLLPAGPARDLFRDAYRHAGEDRGVRLRLIIADRALKQIPWEYLFLDLLGDAPDSMHGFLALNKAVSIVRHEPLPFPHPALIPAPEGLNVLPLLVATASPEGEEGLDLAQEIVTIEKATTGFDLAGVRIMPKILLDATKQDLGEALRGTHSALIFHFAGHGSVGARRDDFNQGVPKSEGYVLLLADRTSRKKDPMSAEDLSRQLKGAGTRLAVLNACYTGTRNEAYPWSGVASALTAIGIPAVLAMQFKVEHLAAEAFSSAFYAALALGLSLDEAVWSGRVAMLQTSSTEPEATANVEWGVPVLYSRLPNGALFPERIKESGSSPAAETFRNVFSQTVTGIQEGKMTGLTVKHIQNGVKVVQKVKDAKGEITGIEAGTAGANANIVVEQEIETAGPGSVIVGTILDAI